MPLEVRYLKATAIPTAMHLFIRNWLPVIGFCILIFVQSSFPTSDHLPTINLSDKVLHFSAYAILAVLFCRAFNGMARLRNRWRLLFLISVMATTAYGLSDELHQSFVPGRNADAGDAVADFAGSLAGSWFYLHCLYVRLRSHTP